MTLLETIISVVAPHICMVCDHEGSLLCEGCWESLGTCPPERCFSCHKLSENSRTCATCRRSSRLNSIWVRTTYLGVPKDLLMQLKFGRARAASILVAKAMAESLPCLPASIIIVPVPTATSRKRERGYDQSVLIASELSKLINRPVKNLLTRLGQSRQVGTKRSERLTQLTESYVVRNTGVIKNTHILLVDDVLTTGATLESAASVLRIAGARRVSAAVFAQA